MVEILVEDAHLLANHNFLRLGEFFGLNDNVARMESKQALEEVLGWSKEKAGSNDIRDVLLYIRGVERYLKGGDFEENRLTKMRRFIAIEQDKERSEKELALLKGVSDDTKLTKVRKFIDIEKDQERSDKEMDLLKGTYESTR